jgi:hypothetical protein
MVGLLGGCVQAERTRYRRHLTRLIEPGPSANRELASAFGLDEFAPRSRASLAAVGDSDEDSSRER